jgi:hypothetical protein
MQERAGAPSMWTVQAPHCAMPQPNLVPVSFRCSRITHSNGVSSPAATSTARPLIVNAVIDTALVWDHLCRMTAR